MRAVYYTADQTHAELGPTDVAGWYLYPYPDAPGSDALGPFESETEALDAGRDFNSRLI